MSEEPARTSTESSATKLPGAPSARTGLLGLSRVFWLLWAGMLINRVGGGVFVFLSLYLTAPRGLRPAAAGLIVGLYAAGGMAAGPIGGLLADRLGRRPTLLLGTGLAGLTMLGLGFARPVWMIAALAPLLGFFTDLARPALNAAVADVVPAHDRRRAYGLLYWAINLGFAGAAALAGKLATISYTLLFVVDAATTLLFGALVFVAVPETRPAPAAPPSYLHEVAIPFRDRRFQLFAGIQFLVMVIFAQFSVAFALDMARHGLPAPTVGRILGLNGVVIVLLQPLALRWFAATPHHRLLAAGGALTGLGLGLSILAGLGVPPVEAFLLALAVVTTGEIAFSMAVPALLAELAPPAHRGGYQGAHQLAWGLAGVAAPPFGAYVLQTSGATPLWLGCLAVGLAAAALHAIFTGRMTETRVV
jgi:MFS family permease